MARPVTFEYRADTRQATRQLDRLDRELDDVNASAVRAGQGARTAGGGFDAFAGRAAAAVVGITAAVAAVRGLVGGLRGLAEELEAQGGVINRFTGNIDEARDRTNGLVSEIELLRASNRASRAGLNLTGRELANITVAVTEYQAATGDTTLTLEQFATALTQGSGEALQKVGIELEGVTDKTERQEVALQQLEDQYGDTESSADTLGGQLQVLEVQIANIETAFFRAFSRVELLDESFQDLIGTGAQLGDVFEQTFTGVAILVQAVSQSISGTIADLVGGAAEAVEQLRSGNFEGAAAAAQRALNAASLTAFSQRLASEIVEGQADLTRALIEAEARALAAEITGRASDRGRRGGEDEDGESSGGARAARRDTGPQLGDAATNSDIAAIGQEAAENLVELERERNEAVRERLAAEKEAISLEQQGLALKQQIREEQRAAAEEAREQAEQRLQALRREREALATNNDGFRALTNTATQFTSALISGEKDLKAVLKEIVKQELARIATRSVYQGLEAFAQGLSLLGNPATVAFAPQKFAAGFAFFALAAAAGGASAAIPSTPSPGGNASAAAPPRESAQREQTGSSLPAVVNITYADPVTDAEIARRNERSRALAEQTLGRI